MPGKARLAQGGRCPLGKALRNEIDMKWSPGGPPSPPQPNGLGDKVGCPKRLGKLAEMPPSNPHPPGNRFGKFGRDDEARRASPTAPGDRAEPTTVAHHPPGNRLFDRCDRLGMGIVLEAGHSNLTTSLYTPSDVAPGTRPRAGAKRRPGKPRKSKLLSSAGIWIGIRVGTKPGNLKIRTGYRSRNLEKYLIFQGTNEGKWGRGFQQGSPSLASSLSDHTIFEQPRRRHIESNGNPLQYNHGRVANTALDTAHVGAVQPAFKGEALLRKPTRLAPPLHVLSDPMPNIHPASRPSCTLIVYRL